MKVLVYSYTFLAKTTCFYNDVGVFALKPFGVASHIIYANIGV